MSANTVDSDGITYRRILFCTDFSANADHAFLFALASAKRSSAAQLHILHVLPEPEAEFWRTYLYEIDDVDAKATADINRKIEESYLRQVCGAVETVVAVRKGQAEEEILTYAKQVGAQLLVIGRQGSRTGLHLFGAVTEKIARKAECPVLIVPFDAG